MTFTPNINNEHAQDYFCPEPTFMLPSHGEKLHRQGRLPNIVQWLTRLSKLPWCNEKLMRTVTGTEAKFTPGSEVAPRSCEQALSSCSELTFPVLGNFCLHFLLKLPNEVDPFNGTRHLQLKTFARNGIISWLNTNGAEINNAVFRRFQAVLTKSKYISDKRIR